MIWLVALSLALWVIAWVDLWETKSSMRDLDRRIRRLEERVYEEDPADWWKRGV